GGLGAVVALSSSAPPSDRADRAAAWNRAGVAMRRRDLALSPALGLLMISACESSVAGAGQDAPTSARDIAVDPEPTVLGERAEPLDVTELRLPLEMTVMIVVDPGWTATPLERDGLFLGYRDEVDRRRFIAAAQ